MSAIGDFIGSIDPGSTLDRAALSGLCLFSKEAEHSSPNETWMDALWDGTEVLY
jgi:hypothetical protein